VGWYSTDSGDFGIFISIYAAGRFIIWDSMLGWTIAVTLGGVLVTWLFASLINGWHIYFGPYAKYSLG